MKYLPKTVKEFINWEFSSDTVIHNDFKEFSKLFKNWIKRRLKKINAKLVDYNIEHYYVSGFISKNNKYVYFSLPDVRFSKWYNEILIRSVKSIKDYTGGRNNFCKLDNFEKLVDCVIQ